MTNLSRFKEVRYKWLEHLYKRTQPTFVVGNKADVPEEKKVGTRVFGIPEEAWKSGHVEISSITGANVSPVIARAIQVALGLEEEGEVYSSDVSNKNFKPFPKYNMADVKGICLIINNQKFQDKKLGERIGSNVDVDNVKDTFNGFGFDVVIRSDLPVSDILAAMKEFSAKDHSKNNIFVTFVMSHGSQGGVFGIDGITISVEKLTEPFLASNCTTLAGKPKIFVVQACQGANVQAATSVVFDHDSLTNNDARKFATTPDESDFLIACSTVEGSVSYRNEDGSIFIGELVKELKSSRNMNFVDVLTSVTGSVANMEFNDGGKQTTCFRSTLTKHVHLAHK